MADLRAGIFDPRSPATGADPCPGHGHRIHARLDPRNVYAASKLSQEHLAAAWARAPAGRAIALRYHNVYGPRMPETPPTPVSPPLFRSALARGEAPQVFEDGAQRRSFIHVRDIAAANIRSPRRSTAARRPAFPRLQRRRGRGQHHRRGGQRS